MKKYQLIYYSSMGDNNSDGIFKTKDVYLSHDELNCLLKDKTTFSEFTDLSMSNFIIRRENVIELTELWGGWKNVKATQAEEEVPSKE